MGIGRIFAGVAIIVIAAVLMAMIYTDALNLFLPTPGERFAFREAFENFRTIYLLISIITGVGLIIWGAQT